MNNVITSLNRLSPLVASVETIVQSFGGELSSRYELEDTVLRAGGYAWDIGADAAPLHAQIAAITQAEAEAEAERIANLSPPAPDRWRVSKDTIIGRIPSASLAAVMGALGSQSPAEQFVFLNSAWFWSDNAQLRGLCAALGLDADALLDRDPFLF